MSPAITDIADQCDSDAVKIPEATIREAPEYDPPPDVRAFCGEHQLDRYLEDSLRRIPRVFQIVGLPNAALEQDGESGEKWVSIRVTVLGSPRDVLAARQIYTGWWVENTPWPERQLIRLSLDAV
jgi:hypothetical protein